MLATHTQSTYTNTHTILFGPIPGSPKLDRRNQGGFPEWRMPPEDDRLGFAWIVTHLVGLTNVGPDSPYGLVYVVGSLLSE